MSLLKALKALHVKAWVKGPGPGGMLLRALKARPMYVQGSRLIQRDIRAKAGHIPRFQHSVVLASPTRPVGPGYYIWRRRRSRQLA